MTTVERLDQLESEIQLLWQSYREKYPPRFFERYEVSAVLPENEVSRTDEQP